MYESLPPMMDYQLQDVAVMRTAVLTQALAAYAISLPELFSYTCAAA